MIIHPKDQINLKKYPELMQIFSQNPIKVYNIGEEIQKLILEPILRIKDINLEHKKS